MRRLARACGLTEKPAEAGFQVRGNVGRLGAGPGGGTGATQRLGRLSVSAGTGDGRPSGGLGVVKPS